MNAKHEQTIEHPIILFIQLLPFTKHGWIFIRSNNKPRGWILGGVKPGSGGSNVRGALCAGEVEDFQPSSRRLDKRHGNIIGIS